MVNYLCHILAFRLGNFCVFEWSEFRLERWIDEYYVNYTLRRFYTNFLFHKTWFSFGFNHLAIPLLKKTCYPLFTASSISCFLIQLYSLSGTSNIPLNERLISLSRNVWHPILVSFSEIPFWNCCAHIVSDWIRFQENSSCYHVVRFDVCYFVVLVLLLHFSVSVVLLFSSYKWCVSLGFSL